MFYGEDTTFAGHLAISTGPSSLSDNKAASEYDPPKMHRHLLDGNIMPVSESCINGSVNRFKKLFFFGQHNVNKNFVCGGVK